MRQEYQLFNDESFFIVIHNKEGLNVAQAQWFDTYDYDIASRFGFDDEKEAITYARFLAIRNGLRYVGEDFKGFLD